MINLVCGDPSNKPATYTRFILPFAYHLTESHATQAATYYKPESITDELWRRRYLTDETEEVLFRRAEWYVLNQETQQVNLTLDGREFKLGLQPARVVLFESPKTSGSKEKKDLLRSGFLIQEIFFPDEGAELTDLLQINELFRYWQKPFAGHEEKGYASIFKQLPISPTLPQPTVGHPQGKDIYFDRWASLLEIPLKDRVGQFWQLIPDTWLSDARKRVHGEDRKDHEPESGWAIYADNRAFTWTCAIYNGEAKPLQKNTNTESGQSPEIHWEWGRLLNVDPSTWKKTSDFENELILKRTYRRWEHFGSLYGYTYHSGALLAPPVDDPDVGKVFGQMYFDQILLLLYLRVAAFRFSAELNRISSRARDAGWQKGWESWRDDFKELRWQFTLLTNLYRFPLLSNQQQGIEMYTCARKQLDVDELFNEVQQEIHSSYEFLSAIHDQEQTEQATRLTVVATVGLIAGLAFSYLGMNVIVDGEAKMQWCNGTDWLIVAGTLIAFSGMMALVLRHTKGISRVFKSLYCKENKERNTGKRSTKGGNDD